jgi:hypothetical protein
MRSGPRRKLLARHDGLAVWRVDGHFIRDRLDVDFTNGSHDLVSRFVPPNEIWLDREAPATRGEPAEGEWRLWLLFQLAHRRRMLAGASYLEALAVAERVEREARRAELGGGPIDRKRDAVRAAALRGLLGQQDGVRIFLVHGRAVRDRAYVHFTMGGHPRRYRFIPPGEVWIDDAVAPAERPAIVHHELVELKLMEDDGLGYHEAHERASAAELRFRRRGGRVGRAGAAVRVVSGR